jgi:hypothetical protein
VTASVAARSIGDASTLTAIVLALVAGAIGIRTWLIAERQRRQSQADKVTGWVAWDEGTPSPCFGAHVQNASDLPIYSVQIWFERKSRDQSVPLMQFVGVVPPGREPQFYPLEDQPQDANVYLYGVTVVFTDSGKRRWCRSSNGDLYRLEMSRLQRLRFKLGR